MSSNPILHQRSESSRNPNNNPNLNLFHESKLIAVEKIQKFVDNREIIRSSKKMKQTMIDNSYRVGLIKRLSAYISTDTCYKLLLGSEDPEIEASFSLFDRRHVTIKVRHITDALSALVKASINNTSTTWIQCCEFAIKNNYCVIKRARTVADWYLDIHRTKSLQFKRSDRGRQSYFPESLFKENENLNGQFKRWTRQDLEHLTIKKCTEFINQKLLNNWTTQQLENNKISHPVSEYICSRWMKEVGYRYEKHKKSYYVDRHEDDDVVRDRKTYIGDFFRDEIFEHCWVQIPKWKYNSLKLTNKIRAVEVKK